jgi:hypothetical protein
MAPLAYFGIESSGLNLVIDLLILFIVVLYLALIYWTYADARRRITDPMLVGCAVAASLFPFVGTIVYMVVRPPEYLEDVQERELETQAAKGRLRELEGLQCPHCEHRIERDYLRCPNCLRKLRERCESCSRPLEPAWTICPYCETEVATAPPPRRMARRRTQAQIESERTEVREAAAASGAPVKGARARAAEARAADEEERPARVAASEASRRQSGGRAGPRGGRARPSP